jgi:hypothetical protein
VEGDGHRAQAIFVRIFVKEALHVSHRRADASLWDMSSLSPEFSKQKHDTCKAISVKDVSRLTNPSHNSNLRLFIP